MEPTRYAIGIGLRKVGKHWCMTKVDSDMNIEDLPLFYKTENKKISSPIRACSSIDGEFIWVAVQDNTGTDLLIHCDESVIQCSLPFTIYKLRQDDLSEVEIFSFKQTQMGSVT